ncbi:hypothetical protein TELCIR_15537, partial [Teladorsagia circumcincta]
VYGVDNLLDNIKWMTGSYPPCYIFWKILWKFVCPMAYLLNEEKDGIPTDVQRDEGRTMLLQPKH